MQAVVKAAGKGTRLRPLTDRRPKALVEVAGEPLLTHVLRRLGEAGIREAIIVVGYLRDAVLEHYGGDFEGIELEYAVQEEPVGLADATLCAESHVDGDFLSIVGDLVYSPNALSTAIPLHRNSGADMTTLTEKISLEQARKTAVFETGPSDGIEGIVEKPDEPPSRYSPAGFFILPPPIFDACRGLEPSEPGEYELTDAIDQLLQDDIQLATAPFEGQRVNVNTPADIERAERMLKSTAEL